MIGAAFAAMRTDAGRFGDGLADALGTSPTVEARAAMMVLAWTLLRMSGGKNV